MLPDFLSSSYASYKEDTTRFARWLACTATAKGYFEDSLIPRTNTHNLAPPSGRLKGKARKEVNDAKKAAQNDVNERVSKYLQ